MSSIFRKIAYFHVSVVEKRHFCLNSIWEWLQFFWQNRYWIFKAFALIVFLSIFHTLAFYTLIHNPKSCPAFCAKNEVSHVSWKKKHFCFDPYGADYWLMNTGTYSYLTMQLLNFSSFDISSFFLLIWGLLWQRIHWTIELSGLILTFCQIFYFRFRTRRIRSKTASWWTPPQRRYSATGA